MATTLHALLLAWMTAAGGGHISGREPEARRQAVPQNNCVKCHGEKKLWTGTALRMLVTEIDFADDVHWQKGLRCHDCHGGDPTAIRFDRAHAVDAGYRPIRSPADIPAFCGHCHSDIQYMRNYRPSARTDQVVKYWASGHGRRLKKYGDPNVATCVSCHGHHGIRPVNDARSPVYPLRLARTCATCHSDPRVTAGRQYHGRPLGHNQLALWLGSVHGRTLLQKGNLSAPTCNDCHGGHAAVPPDVDSVANACGQCHRKIFGLFSHARMKHRFEEVGLPGCVTCHANHDIRSPSDEMLGMGPAAVCASCHAEGQFGAPLAGAKTVLAMRSGLERLKNRISQADLKLSLAERLGMDVRGPRFDLRNAVSALTNARTSMHGFAIDPMRQYLDGGLEVAELALQRAESALRRHTWRRIWLGVSVLPMLAVVLLLLLYIRALPPPAVSDRPRVDSQIEARHGRS